MNRRIRLAAGLALVVGVAMVPLGAGASDEGASSRSVGRPAMQASAGSGEKMMPEGSGDSMDSGSGEMMMPEGSGDSMDSGSGEKMMMTPAECSKMMMMTPAECSKMMKMTPAECSKMMKMMMPAGHSKTRRGAVEGGFGSGMNSGGTASADGMPAAQGHGDNQGGDIH